MSQSFFNSKAFDVCVWSYEESNRLKASRIYKVALNMEERYRRFNGIPQKCSKLVGSNVITFAKGEKLAAVKAIINKK